MIARCWRSERVKRAPRKSNQNKNCGEPVGEHLCTIGHSYDCFDRGKASYRPGSIVFEMFTPRGWRQERSKRFLDAYERARAYPHQRIETQNTYRWYSTKFLISIFGSGERINYIDSVRLTRNCANGNFLSSSIPCSHRYGIAMAPFNGC